MNFSEIEMILFGFKMAVRLHDTQYSQCQLLSDWIPRPRVMSLRAILDCHHRNGEQEVLLRITRPGGRTTNRTPSQERRHLKHTVTT